MADSEKVSSLPSERAAILRAMAEKWHDEETLGDSTCDHRELEIHAYIAGYSAASAGRQELLQALRMARDHIACSICHHDETARRGLIWTECLQCGCMFADDQGGVPKPKEPPVLAAIRKALGEQQ